MEAKASQDAVAENASSSSAFHHHHHQQQQQQQNNDDVTIPLKQNANFELYDVCLSLSSRYYYII